MAAEPIRMCAVCRQRSPKGLLIRWQYKQGKLVEDKQKHAAGRGCYTHPNCDDSAKIIKAIRR